MRHVHADDVDEVLVDLAAVLIFQDRDLQPFGIDVGGHAAEQAADIDPMRHAAGEADQHALVEDRQGQGDVVEVAAGRVGVVGDVDVARLMSSRPKCLILALTVSAMPRMNIGRPMPIDTVSPSA